MMRMNICIGTNMNIWIFKKYLFQENDINKHLNVFVYKYDTNMIQTNIHMDCYELSGALEKIAGVFKIWWK